MYQRNAFSLIELMVVVAIIGVLAAIAVPNFLKFQTRARQSEAKANLRGLWITSKTVFQEKHQLNCGFCGWKPEGTNLYTYRAHNGSKEVAHAGTHGGPVTRADEAAVDVNSGRFTINAVGDIDGDPFFDEWSQSDANLLCNGSAAGGTCDHAGNDVEH